MNFLKALFSLVFIGMIYVVMSTSFQSNLLELMRTWDPVNVMAPWFSATLWDFYANVLFISVWVIYKENSLRRSAVWIILLIGLGSIATAGYVLLQLFRLKPEDGLEDLFIRRTAQI